MAWTEFDHTGIWYKNMNYTYSCFFCCLHVALYNLGKYRHKDSSIEVAANQKFNLPALDTTAPTIDQLEGAIPQLIQNLSPQIPSLKLANLQAETVEIARNTVITIGNLVGNYAIITAMLDGGGHARMIVRVKEDYYYFNPSPDKSEFVRIKEFGAGVVSDGGNRYGVQFRDGSAVITAGEVFWILQ